MVVENSILIIINSKPEECLSASCAIENITGKTTIDVSTGKTTIIEIVDGTEDDVNKIRARGDWDIDLVPF